LRSSRLKMVRCCALLALLLGACSGGLGSYFDPTAAVVGGTKISENRVAVELKRAISNEEHAEQFRGPKGAENRVAAQRLILTQLIRQTALVRKAEDMGIEVSDEEVAQALEQLKSRFGSKEAFRKEVLEETMLSEDEIRGFLRDRLIVDRAAREVTKDVRASEEQIAAFYNENKKGYDDQLRTAHVLICSNFNSQTRTCEAAPGDEAQAVVVANLARQGKDFSQLVQQYSQDPQTKDRGGDLGWSERGRQVPEFEKAALELKVGQTSGVVRTPFGFHIIKLLARGRPLDEARSEIEEALVKDRRRQAVDAWAQTAMKDLEVRVNPKFGRFDPKTVSVVAPDKGGAGNPDASRPVP
jgi:foldase protein PrsA